MSAHSSGLPVVAAAVLVSLTLTGCGGDNNEPNPPAQGRTIYAVDLSNNFSLFHSGTPGTVDRHLPITGLLVGDRIVGIDFRPADGKLYGVGTDSRVYTLDTVTAVASPVGPTFTPALDGEHFGVALDAATDRILVQSAETGQNLRLDPSTGEVASEDAVLVYVAGDAHADRMPEIAATAVSTLTGATMTYGIDWFLDDLVVMADPSSGQVSTVGSTGVSTSPCAALDLGDDGLMYASMTISTVNNLYTINLSTGAATPLGPIDVVASIQSIAIPAGGSAFRATSMPASPLRTPVSKPAGLATARPSRTLAAVDPAKSCR